MHVAVKECALDKFQLCLYLKSYSSTGYFGICHCPNARKSESVGTMNLQPKNISISRPDFLRQWSSAATNSASQNRSSKSNTNHYRTKAAIGSFFRSAGLKLLFRAFSSDKEQKKIVVGASRWLAFARAGVHILPMAMTIMIVGMNWAQLLNGPAMSTLMVFVLQVVAKLHVRITL